MCDFGCGSVKYLSFWGGGFVYIYVDDIPTLLG